MPLGHRGPRTGPRESERTSTEPSMTDGTGFTSQRGTGEASVLTWKMLLPKMPSLFQCSVCRLLGDMLAWAATT